MTDLPKDPIVTISNPAEGGAVDSGSWYASSLRAAFKQHIDLPLLQRKVFVIGKNGAGKSAIGMALELATTGRAQDIDATGAGLMECAPEGASEASASVTLRRLGGSETAYVSYGTKKTGARVSKPSAQADGLPPGVYFEHVGTVLTREVEALLGKSKKAQRAALVKVVAPENLLDEARELIAEKHREEFDAYIQRAEVTAVKDNGDDEGVGGGSGGATDADVLVAARDLVAKAVTDARRAAKIGKEEPMPDAPTEAEAEALLRRASDLRGALEEVAKRAAAGEHKTRLIARVGELRGQIANAPGAPDPAVLAQLEAAEAQQAQTVTVLRAAQVLLEYAAPVLERRRVTPDPVMGDQIRCPCCRGLTASLDDAWLAFNADALKMSERGEFLKAKRIELAPPSTAAAALQVQLDRVLQDLQEVEGLLVQPLSAAAGAATPEQLTEAEAHSAAAAAKRAALTAWEQQRSETVKAESRVDDLAALAKAIERVITLKLEGSLTQFETAANEAIGENLDGWRVRVVLFEGKKAVTKIGLARGKDSPVRPWKALSGAQQALLFSAVATAMSRRSKKLVRLVRIDDIAMDEDMIDVITAGLDKALDIAGGPTQAVVCSLTASTGLVADLKERGWQVIYAPATAAVAGELKAGNGAAAGVSI